MKKFLTATCAVALALGLAGCSSQPAEEAEPEAPQQVEGLTDEASLAKARDLMEAMFAAPPEQNQTMVISVNTSTEQDGQALSNTVTTTTMRDLTGETAKYYMKIATDPVAETDATYYIDGVDGVIELAEGKVPVEYDADEVEAIVKPSSNSDSVRAYYDCAESISYYDKDGAQVVNIQVDPAKLMESGVQSETFSNIESCVAEYTFNAEGKLVTFLNTIEGTIKGTDGTDVQATIQTSSITSNVGTTEVPALPEVTEEDMQAAMVEQPEGEQAAE